MKASRILSLLLVLACLFVGCNKSAQPAETTPEVIAPLSTTPEVTTTEVTTTETTPPTEEDPVLPIPTKELSAVTILAGETETEQFAAAELQKHLEIKGISVEADAFPITLSIDSALGDDAYRIEGAANVTEEQNGDEYLNIIGGNGRGVIYGVVRFLEDYAGTRFFTYELETHTPDPVTVPQSILIDYQPVFAYRDTNWNIVLNDPTFCAKIGMNGYHGNITDDIGGCIVYGEELFVHTLGWLTETDYPYPKFDVNPCLALNTAEGQENLAKVIKNLRAVLEKDPTIDIVSVSQNDTKAHCECDACLAIEAEEGSPAGTLLRFVNAVAENLEADYPNLTVDTLAYKYTRKAPTKTVPRDNVCVRLCSIECHFNHPLTTESCEICSAFRYDLIEWGKICDNIYIWDYNTDFSYYLSFFPNLHVLRDNMQLFADNNVKGVFCHGNMEGPSGEFGELRAYLLTKLMMYPYMTEEEYYAHMDEFLAAYYGAGWKSIRAYIDQLCALALLGEGHTIYHQPFASVNENIYRVVEPSIDKWWADALAKAGDRLEYVERSYLHVRYMQLMLHPDAEKAAAIITEVEGLGMAWREGKYHVDKNNSNFSKGPGMWTYY